MAKVREGYKETELGVIPEDWEVKGLGELSKVKRGASPRPISDPKWFSNESNIGWIRISDVTSSSKYLNRTEQYLSEAGVDKSRQVFKGELIMSICASIGVPIILNMDACIHDGFVVFNKLNNNLNTEYLYYYISKIQSTFKGKGQTGTQANINTDLVSNTLIPLPPLQEQQRIAEILSTTDEHIEKLDKTIEDYQFLKKGMMKKLLTEGIGHTEFKETEIGRIPKEWEVSTIEQICDILDSNRRPLNSVQRNEMKGNIPYYGANGIVDYVNDFLFDEDLILLAEDGGNFEDYTNKPIAYRISGKSWINNHAHILKPKDNYNFDWIFYSLEHKDITDFVQGGTRSKLNQKDLRKITITLPPILEQALYSNIFNEIDNKIDQYQQQRQDFTQLKKALMEQLLTGKIRVKQ